MIDYAVTLLTNRETGEKRAYAFLQSRGTLSIDDIADHMVSHGCQYDRGDIIAVIAKLVTCAKELMLDGYRLQLGDLGRFYLTCQSHGAESLEKFTHANIKAINVNFASSKHFADITQRVSLHRVPTRKAVAATLQAQTEGQTNADWSADTAEQEGGE